jgi:hypothetical protein
MGRIVDIAEVLLEVGLSGSVTDEERAIATTSIRKAESAVIRHLRYDPVQQERTEIYPIRQTNQIVPERVLESTDTVAYFRNVSRGATDELGLRHVPVRSISSLRIDYAARSGAATDAFPAESEKTEGDDFWANYDQVDSDGNKVCSDGILRSVGIWPLEPGTVRVVYTAGWTPEELHGQDTVIDAGSIADAVILESVRRINRAFALKKKTSGFAAGVYTSEKLGDYSYTIDGSSSQRALAIGQALTPDSIGLLETFVNWGW